MESKTLEYQEPAINQLIDNKALFTNLGGLDLDNIEYLADLKEKKGDEWKAFLAFCDSTVNNKYFEPFLKALKFAQMKKAYDWAENYEQFNFGRNVSIAIDLLSKEFKDRSVDYQTLINK